MRVRLTSRRSADSRCAFCHDALEGAIASCPRCYTAFHRDCREHLTKCPTLGCETTFAQSLPIEAETETPLSLGWEILMERVGGALLGPALAMCFALVAGYGPFALPHEEKDRIVWVSFLVAIAVGGVWWLRWAAREARFVGALSELLGRTPVRQTIEIHVRTVHESRSFSAHLLAEDGSRVLLDLDPAMGSAPGWLCALAPGTPVDVFDAGSGPVAIRTLDQHSYAVPEARVTRTPPRELPRLDEAPPTT
jgi:hypothetical protein